MGTDHWDYTPLRERLAVTAISGTTGALLGWGLAGIFNPAALGLAAGYALYKTGRYYQGAAFPALTQNYIARLQKKNQLGPRLQRADLVALAEDLRRDFNIAAAPQLYTVKPAFILQNFVPWFLRPLVRRMHLIDKDSIFGILPPDNLLLVPDGGLKKYKDSEVKFIFAHELAHLKARDDFSLFSVLSHVSKHATNALLYGSLAVAGLAALGLSLPVALTLDLPVLAALGVAGLLKAGSILGLNGASRMIERRADRNALYITRDLDSADKALRRTDSGGPGRLGRLGETLSSHPSYFYRSAALKAAWEKIKDYPAAEPPASAGPDSSDPGPVHRL